MGSFNFLSLFLFIAFAIISIVVAQDDNEQAQQDGGINYRTLRVMPAGGGDNNWQMEVDEEDEYAVTDPFRRRSLKAKGNYIVLFVDCK